MFLTTKRERLIQFIKLLAEKYQFGLTELGNDDNNVLQIQPYDLRSQVGPDKELVERFCLLIQRQTRRKLKNGVSFSTKSKPSGRNPDYSESEPDFATPTEIHFIELRFS